MLPLEVASLTPGEFQSMVRSSSAQAPGQRVAWLVFFHADWCSASHNLQPMFGALARRCVCCQVNTALLRIFNDRDNCLSAVGHVWQHIFVHMIDLTVSELFFVVSIVSCTMVYTDLGGVI